MRNYLHRWGQVIEVCLVPVDATAVSGYSRSNRLMSNSEKEQISLFSALVLFTCIWANDKLKFSGEEGVREMIVKNLEKCEVSKESVWEAGELRASKGQGLKHENFHD